MIPLIAYTNRQSCRPGEPVDVKVSSSCSSPFYADLVRLRCVDPNPAGPGKKITEVEAPFAGFYQSRLQRVAKGSYFHADLSPAVDGHDWTFSIRVQPWLLEAAWQTIACLSGVWSIKITDAEVALFHHSAKLISLPTLALKQWYELRLQITPSEAVLSVLPLEPNEFRKAHQDTARSLHTEPLSWLVLAAERDMHGKYAGHFNGRLEDAAFVNRPGIVAEPMDLSSLPPDQVLHWWDFSEGISTEFVKDIGSQSCDGTLVNLPTRAVCGSRWSGREMSWRHAPSDYAAIHFHEDDLYDCGWKTDFVVQVPADLKSGVYGIRLRCEGHEDILPLYVLPGHGRKRAPIAVLIPTFTYQAYANFDRANFDEAYKARRAQWTQAYPHHPAEHRDYGLSTYDTHRDGSGVMFASRRRPAINDRPSYLAYVDLKGSGLRHLSADMHLIDWLEASGFEYDVLTDHELHSEGVALLRDYPCTLTGTHPEYHTTETLDAIRDYLAGGGNFVYLGGNGFYWRVAVSETIPDMLEVRRAESGTRAWAADSGEYYHALDGAFGGLWRRIRRAPQQLVGVGMSAQGKFEGTYYRRKPQSYEPELAWMFENIDDEKLGDFGLSGGGAAGFELDRADLALGTPTQAIVVATSEGHQSHFGVTPEEVLSTLPNIGGGGSADLIRADLTYFETGHGGAVFSTGSITFCGSLSHQQYRNNISTLLGNVVRRFTRGVS